MSVYTTQMFESQNDMCSLMWCGEWQETEWVSVDLCVIVHAISSIFNQFVIVINENHMSCILSFESTKQKHLKIFLLMIEHSKNAIWLSQYHLEKEKDEEACEFEEDHVPFSSPMNSIVNVPLIHFVFSLYKRVNRNKRVRTEIDYVILLFISQQ